MAAALGSSESSQKDVHSSATEDPASSTVDTKVKEQSLCYFFNSKKGCRNGANCKFLHAGEIAEKVSDEDQKKSPDQILSSQLQNVQLTENSSGSLDALDTQEMQDSNVRPKKVCYFYAKSRMCRFGRNCRFAHVSEQHEKHSYEPSEANDEDSILVDTPSTTSISDSAAEQSNSKTNPEKSNKRKRICKFFKSGNCSMGNRCRFWHPPDLMDVSQTPTNLSDKNKSSVDQSQASSQSQKKNAAKQSQKHDKPKQERRQVNVMQRYAVSQLGPNYLLDLRDTELEQVRKRYPDAKAEKEGSTDCFSFIFKPTDPDWPFDVTCVSLKAMFAEDYPLKPLKIVAAEEEDIPPIIQKNLERKISEWIDTRFSALMNDDKAELMFRPFLKWLDRQLEEIFAEGLRKYKKELLAEAAGVEFVPASQLQEQYRSQVDTTEKDSEGDSEHSSEEEENDDNDGGDSHIGEENAQEQSGGEEEEGEEEEEEEEKEQEEVKKEKACVIDPVKRGTEMKLKNLQLKENAATLQARKLCLVIQCERCKNQTEVSTPAKRLNSVLCSRCGAEQFVTFRPAMTHQFSSTLGYLDLVDCVAFDVILLDCKFNVGCLQCNKQAVMDGLPPGQMKDLWCRYCHGKQSYATEGVRFQQLQPAGDLNKDEAGKAHVVPVKRQKKVIKDPAIQEGKPLPDNGVCKHYRKSFRWFRFPCCGKTYPCDICHDMNEIGHEMKYANRVICGYCCREQPFSAERPCVGCHQSMTKKASAHWEGGKGCRDKTKMSRLDTQKYSSVNKTVSRKAQEKQQNKSGKKK